MQFIALIGTVSLEIALVSRFWTRLFALAWSLSYLLTLPWLVIIPLVSAHTSPSGVHTRLLPEFTSDSSRF